MSEWKQGIIYHRKDGFYYQAEGNDNLGYVRLFNPNGIFKDKHGQGYPDLKTADTVCRLFADTFNEGWTAKHKSGIWGLGNSLRAIDSFKSK